MAVGSDIHDGGMEGWRWAPDGVWPESQGSAEVSGVTAGLRDRVGGRNDPMQDDVTGECCRFSLNFRLVFRRQGSLPWTFAKQEMTCVF